MRKISKIVTLMFVAGYLGAATVLAVQNLQAATDASANVSQSTATAGAESQQVKTDTASIQSGWAESKNDIQVRDHSLREIFQDLKEAGDNQKKESITKELRNRHPVVKEDIEILSKEMEGDMAPVAQELIGETTDINLLPHLIQASEEKVSGLRNLRQKDFDRMTEQEKKKEVNHIVSISVLAETMGKFKDKRAIPILKKLLDYEQLSYQASTALSQIGDEATLNELMQRLDTQKELNLSGYGHSAFTKILKKLDDPTISERAKANLLNQFGTSRVEDKPLLKELVMKHKDRRVRDKAGLALMYHIRANPEASDKVAIIDWVRKADQTRDDSTVWGIYAMDFAWYPDFIPVLIDVLKKSKSVACRENAIEVLKKHRVRGACPEFS